MHDLEAIRRAVQQTAIAPADFFVEGVPDPGPIALHGEAVKKTELIDSPISGVPVIGYRIQFAELGFFGGTKHSFAVRGASPFFIQRGDMQLEVAPSSHCYLYLTHEYSGTPEQMGSIANAAYKLFAQHGPRRKARGTPRIRWHEFYLEPGESIYVCGWLKHEFDMGARQGYRSHNKRPIICGTEEHPLIIADYDRATLLAKIDAVEG